VNTGRRQPDTMKRQGPAACFRFAIHSSSDSGPETRFRFPLWQSWTRRPPHELAKPNQQKDRTARGRPL